MTSEELLALRKILRLTQAEMAERIGLSKSAYVGIENGSTPIRMIHGLAAERVALRVALEQNNPMHAPASIRKEAIALVKLFTDM